MPPLLDKNRHWRFLRLLPAQDKVEHHAHHGQQRQTENRPNSNPSNADCNTSKDASQHKTDQHRYEAYHLAEQWDDIRERLKRRSYHRKTNACQQPAYDTQDGCHCCILESQRIQHLSRCSFARFDALDRFTVLRLERLERFSFLLRKQTERCGLYPLLTE